jgi:hypothetical protein
MSHCPRHDGSEEGAPNKISPIERSGCGQANEAGRNGFIISCLLPVSGSPPSALPLGPGRSSWRSSDPSCSGPSRTEAPFTAEPCDRQVDFGSEEPLDVSVNLT